VDFLLEIGVEELPSGYIEPAIDELAAKVAAELAARRVAFRSVEKYSTPRRLAVVVTDLAGRQADLEKEVTGPSAKAAYGADGRPTQAAKGFARSQGVAVESLFLKDTEKGKYVCAHVKIEGKPTAEVLPDFLPALVLSLSFPKTMTWGAPSARFARPIRWVVALLDGDVVPLEVAGVKSNRVTYGNRFASPSAIHLSSPAEYLTKLESAAVMADLPKRRSLVREMVHKGAKNKGGRVVEDQELVDIVANLLEYPVPIVGSFDAHFLELPREVVVTAMREHQRYFAVEDHSGKLMPHFITARNGGSDGEENIRTGNERVLKARLDDARFYWEKDLSIGVERQLELLKDVVWHESLGSVYQKGTRLSELAASVVAVWDKSKVEMAKRAGLICKTDLVSEMVKDGKEFTTLQGIIGGEYAARAGEFPPVVQAVKEHYFPRFPGDAVPSTLIGAAVGIADRLDEIAGCFATEKTPTGSEDPYGVRRQANGLMRILIEKELHFSLGDALDRAVELLSRQFKLPDSLAGDVRAFLIQRLGFVLSEAGLEQDVIHSVLSVDSDDPYRSLLKARAVAEWKPNADFSHVAISFKRVSNILKADSYPPVKAEELTEKVEKELFSGLKDVSSVAAQLISQANYADAIARLLTLKGPIDAFFDGVLVMDPDERVRSRRLSLLAMVRAEFLKLADFSKLYEAAQPQA
jgi:glycyl-tRNA synthetase beta chain